MAKKTNTVDADNARRADETIRAQEALMSPRGPLEQTWDAIARRIFTSFAGQFTQQNLSIPAPGIQRTTEMLDTTGANALIRFAAAMESMLTPRNSRWHHLVPSDPVLRRNRSVRLWFEELTDVLFQYRYAPRANYASQKHEEYMALGAFGTGCQFIDKLRFYGERGLRYRNMHLGQTYAKENHQGIIDTCYRRFPLTARQAVQKFGADVLPEKILTDSKSPKDGEKPHFFIHCVKPREDYDPGRLDLKGMRYDSHYVSVTDRHFIREDGYYIFPYTFSRYITVPNELYGQSPAMMALPSLRLLNEQKKVFIKQGHRISDPVLLTHDDGVLDTLSLRPGSSVAGGVSPDGKLLVQPLPTGDVQITREMMEMEQHAINDFFLVTLFQILVETPSMTATEVVERAREKGALLSPTMGRQQSESLGPGIEREVDCLEEQGLLPPMPEMLREARAEYAVQYDSPLSRMAKAEESSGFMRAVDWAVEKVQVTQDPEPLDHFNFDKAIPALAEQAGVPESWMNPLDVVMQKRDARAKQRQQQTMVDAAPAASNVLKTVASLGQS